MRRIRLASLSLLFSATATVLGGCGSSSGVPVDTGSASPDSAQLGHVFLLVLENKSYDRSFGPDSAAPYLAKTLPARGVLLENYYSTGHASLDNYISMISGQAPNMSTQDDCTLYHDFLSLGTLGTNGQAIGQGCVFPNTVPSLPDQLRTAGISWKGYMEDMGNELSRYDPANPNPRTCGHPKLGGLDNTQSATATDQYATRHDPFMYFHSIIDDTAYCDSNVVNLADRFADDLQSIDTTPAFSFITPNLCNDGHDSNCANGDVGGLTGINDFLQKWVPVITNSPAFRKDGLLIILYDESEGSDTEDNTMCCGEAASLPTNTLLPPGQQGPGGGRVGAVLLSPFIKAGTISQKTYNHYSMLRSVERIFGLPYLGYAAAGAADGTTCNNDAQPCSFDSDVFTGTMPSFPARPQS